MIRAITKFEELFDNQYLVDYVEFRCLDGVGEFLTDNTTYDVLIDKDTLHRDFVVICDNKPSETFEALDIFITDLNGKHGRFEIKYTINDGPERSHISPLNCSLEKAMVTLTQFLNLAVDALVLPTYTYK